MLCCLNPLRFITFPFGGKYCQRHNIHPPAPLFSEISISSFALKGFAFGRKAFTSVAPNNEPNDQSSFSQPSSVLCCWIEWIRCVDCLLGRDFVWHKERKWKHKQDNALKTASKLHPRMQRCRWRWRWQRWPTFGDDSVTKTTRRKWPRRLRRK